MDALILKLSPYYRPHTTRAWRSLQKSGIYFTCREAEAARERLAKRIIENAKGGERDPRRLRDNALLDLTRSSGSQFKRRLVKSL
jgi:hypothetical protein